MAVLGTLPAQYHSARLLFPRNFCQQGLRLPVSLSEPYRLLHLIPASSTLAFG